MNKSISSKINSKDGKILNLTIHPTSIKQIKDGVVDMLDSDQAVLVHFLTVEDLPDKANLAFRAGQIAGIAYKYQPDKAMIGGIPCLMAFLETALKVIGIQPVYAFSIRESVENPETGEKISKFNHLGFVEV